MKQSLAVWFDEMANKTRNERLLRCVLVNKSVAEERLAVLYRTLVGHIKSISAEMSQSATQMLV